MKVLSVVFQKKVGSRYVSEVQCMNPQDVGCEMLAVELADKYLCKCTYITRIIRKQHYNHQQYLVYYHPDFGGGRRVYTVIE